MQYPNTKTYLNESRYDKKPAEEKREGVVKCIKQTYKNEENSEKARTNRMNQRKKDGKDGRAEQKKKVGH